MKYNLVKKQFHIIILVCIASIFSVSGFASKKSNESEQSKEPKQTLAQFFEEEVLAVDTILQGEPTEMSLVGDHSSDDAYFFRRFWLRLRPRVERDIPWLAGFSVIPELEMLFEKQTPEGWEIYKINKKH